MELQNFEFVDGWRLAETRWNPEEETSRATVYALANGYMGSRGAFEEADPRQDGVVGNYINGIYDTPRGKLTEREIVNIPDWHAVWLEVDGERLDLTTGHVLEYRRELDMREAVLRRRVRWQSPSGKVIVLESERFLSMVRTHLAVLRYRVTAESDCRVRLFRAVLGRVNNRWADHTHDFTGSAYVGGISTLLTTKDPGYHVQVDTADLLDGPAVDWNGAAMMGGIGAMTRPEIPMSAGETITLTRYAAIHDSRFTQGNLVGPSQSRLSEAEIDGYDAIKKEHVERWAEIWNRSDVAIDGDDDAQLGIRFSLFHLLAAAPWHNDRISVPARGLQGQDYYGSIFWDCEIFVFPMLCATQPDVARNCLSYRWHTLNGARRKANNYGFDGAFYAWQSQETGDDQCALYVFNNPFTGRPMRAPFSDQQVHISADIVYALWQYWQYTGDDQFIAERGAEIAVEVARFFANRVEKAEDGSYHMTGVLGPDEYHESVTDDAYSNVMARFALETALHLWKVAQSEIGPTAWPMRMEFSPEDHVTDTVLPTEEEMEKWREIRDNLYLPQPDENGLIEQFAGYFGLEDAPVSEVRNRIPIPGMYPGGPLGPFQSTQIIKQADVVMMLYLMRDLYSTDIKKANWDYYEARTAHDSSLSAMAYSLVAADIGLTDWAYKYFIHTSHIDLASYGPHWNLGIHAAGLGGAWLALIHGFCQFEQRVEGAYREMLNLANEAYPDEPLDMGDRAWQMSGLWLREWPRLPTQWKEIRFSCVHHGQVVGVTVQPNGVRLEHKGSLNDVPLKEIAVFGPDIARDLEPGSIVELARPA